MFLPKYFAVIFLFALLLYPVNVLADKSSPEGQWVTVDDESGKDRSIIRLWIEHGKLNGQILKLIDTTEENPVCTECDGALKNQPIQGMTILGDAKLQGRKWTGGYIIDPNSGKQYKAVLELIDSGQKIKVRGFIGVSIFGRTQIWRRQEP